MIVSTSVLSGSPSERLEFYEPHKENTTAAQSVRLGPGGAWWSESARSKPLHRQLVLDKEPVDKTGPRRQKAQAGYYDCAVGLPTSASDVLVEPMASLALNPQHEPVLNISIT